MKPSLFLPRSHLLKYLSVSLLTTLASACGPWLPEAYVLRNDDFFYSPPEVGFAAELRHILPESVPHQAVLTSPQAPAQNAEAELTDALKSSTLPTPEQEATLTAYRNFRKTLDATKNQLQPEPSTAFSKTHSKNATERQTLLDQLHALKVPSGLPEEFAYYLQGALAYHRGEITEARHHWQAVLDLPSAERPYRSVTAAYMLARTDTSAAAPEGFHRVRELANAGYADAQGLAAASYGWEGRHYLDRGEYAESIQCYLRHWKSGYANAVLSLKIVAGAAWESAGDKEISELVGDEPSRAVLTAYLLTQSESPETETRRARLLRALPTTTTLTVAEAGRFALIEYQRNNLSATRLWLEHADSSDALALWIRSKMLLREGRIEAGRALMLALTEQMGDGEPNWRELDTARAWGELGLLMLRQKEFIEATHCFYNSGSWQDTAYLLERVLETEELIDWTRAHLPENDEADDAFERKNLRSLTARRLMREARFETALEFFTAEAKDKAETYIRSMRAASDTSRPADDRAYHYWTAAHTMRNHGLALFAAELSPDHAWSGGNYEHPDLPGPRFSLNYIGSHTLNQMSSAEESRVRATRIRPDKRFHYRYRAAQLAELAAGLLPNDNEDAARIYLTAGTWLKTNDPEAADRFYKYLVVRCPNTPLGKAAAQINWFPPVHPDGVTPFP